MVSKKKYYDVEQEFADSEGAADSGFTFLDWLKFAETDALESARKREIQSRVIESFIQNAPKIKPVKKGDELLPDAPEETPEKEKPVNQEDIVSETLAQIYEEQGFFSRASEVYRKLGLINPEKSNYFAARLKELRKKESELKK